MKPCWHKNAVVAWVIFLLITLVKWLIRRQAWVISTVVLCKVICLVKRT